LLQENPNSNVNTNYVNSNWKGSPNKNFKNKQNRGGSQGGYVIFLSIFPPLVYGVDNSTMYTLHSFPVIVTSVQFMQVPEV